jgi:hypothetical protein
VDRFIRLMADDPRAQVTGEGEKAETGDERSAFRQLRGDLARAVDANLDLIRRAFDLYAGAVDRLLGDDSASPPSGGHHFKLPPVLPGHRASSTLWIHNTTTTATSALRLHGSELISHNGERIPAGAWQFEPEEIDIAPAGSSLPIAVDLEITRSVAPGIYRGYVFVTNLPAEFMTMEVEVVQPAGVSQEQWWRDQQRVS